MQQPSRRQVPTKILTLVLVSLIVSVPSPLVGQVEDERVSLRGIPYVYVVIDINNDGDLLQRDTGISDNSLRNRAIARLRTSRIPVVETVPEKGGAAVLTVQLRALQHEGRASYTWSLDVTIAQHVALLRDPSIDFVAVTWGNHAFGSGPASQVADAIPRKLDQFLDRFINEFLAENEQ
ncbi:MAG TPA: hypothetical protein VJG13_14105 [Thermoanaerobaculia bacterium]|nr:hypothetical protein [Thermoanaerobaculia bacterium]